MSTVARSSHEFQMSTTPQERVRQQLAGKLVPQLAELLYRYDKGHDMARLSDLPEAGRAVYLAEALERLSTAARIERLHRVQAAIAQGHAVAENEQETVTRQARADIARFGFVGPGAVKGNQ